MSMDHSPSAHTHRDAAPSVLDLIARLEVISAAFEQPAPWCIAALSGGIRHLQRNCDVMEDYQEDASEEDKSGNLPGRYDGEPLAQLRNLLPDIIASLKATTANSVGTEAPLGRSEQSTPPVKTGEG